MTDIVSNKSISIIGKKINAFTVLGDGPKNKILCRCECGKESYEHKITIIHGSKKSCKDCSKKWRDRRNYDTILRYDRSLVLKFNEIVIKSKKTKEEDIFIELCKNYNEYENIDAIVEKYLANKSNLCLILKCSSLNN